MAYYFDTSAAVKLVVRERETPALVKWCEQHDGQLVSSDLTRTELLRATRRAAPESVLQARAVLETFMLLSLPTELFERAATLEPDLLRSLDALHLAAALAMGDDLEGVVTYDDRLADAAGANGIAVVAPGA